MSDFNNFGDNVSHRNDGGFVSSSGGMANSQDGQGERRAAINQSFRSVTLKQVNELTQTHPDAPLRIDGRDLTHITLVAVLRNLTEQAMHYVLMFEDGTGVADVHVWPNDTSDLNEDRINSLPVGGYVRVIGQVRSFNNKRHILALQLVPINDHNEITMHMLEVIQTHLYFTRGMTSMLALRPLVKQSTIERSAYGAASTSSLAPMSGVVGGTEFTPLQRGIMAFVGTKSDEAGAHIMQIASAVNLGKEAIMKDIEWLVAEGHMYSTIDDDHFRTMD
ncbi:hypothetical protein THASP1DRAFT_31605 [Thamnocephalis sphaerospora]|uniref:Replication protein A C-terminal domain-containing protein n=1 Tax=Thamnocephalis sphaerospora TaxID=78915 RepID=A0A4P9XL57_9FUNG|nr:hypothetical protein THASP1DRAFT_31605 [Thamnocephalis sphaerospora]|eukprot:RKP06577.1 hypothetical protein THASP1DRAFT_31605 [Thamnocephalis sphaerospora]